ncbi:MAG: hypothetical protein JO254_13050, partial [Pseudolabrys sp.]|nr:hypothetical protein [Pseudolabrys sp.]
ETGEQIEGLYGERWKDTAPLAVEERADIMRAAIGYALGEEPIGLDRLREKYGAKMNESEDKHAFEVVTAPIGVSGEEFRKVISAAAGVNTLDAFLKDLQTRYPASTEPAADAKGDVKADLKTPALPVKPLAGVRTKSDPATTGSISRQARPRAGVR